MERLSPSDAEQAWARYDAIPRDGPALFVVRASDQPEHGPPDGHWIRAGNGSELLTDLHTKIGPQAIRDRDLAVIDQVGMGPAMLPEDLALSALAWRLTTGEAS